MKFKLFSFLTVFVALMFTGCVEDDCTQDITYLKYHPVYMGMGDIRTPIATTAAREMKNPGKIYFYQNILFINEYEKGIHIIDNNNPSNPQNIGFIAIPGNKDIAVKGDRLYADNYMDLLTLDISDIRQVRLAFRLQDAFRGYQSDANGIVVGYTTEEVTEAFDCNESVWLFDDNREMSFDAALANGSGGSTVGSNTARPSVGTGGSFASMTIYDNYIYSLYNNQINVFDISTPNYPDGLESVHARTVAETAYVFRDYLFIGGQTGMNIFDLSNPASPEYVSGYSHQTGCDPVAVHGDHAYVTIHADNTCVGDLNQLDVLDISDILRPELKQSFAMQKPKGLAVNADALFLCEGEYGMKVFGNNEPLAVGNNLLKSLTGFDAYDVIIVPGQEDLLLLIGKDGFYQFDISDAENPSEISFLPVYRD